MITQEEVNQLAEYKIRERRARATLVNGLSVLLAARADRADLDRLTIPGNELELARDFYEAQLTVNPQAVAVFDQIEAKIGEIHSLMWIMQSADPAQNIFPGLPEPE